MALAHEFSAAQVGTAIRVTGTVVDLPTDTAPTLDVADATIDHDPSELRLRLRLETASSSSTPGDGGVEVVVDRTFDAGARHLTHVVVSLEGDIQTERYGGDSLNIPIH